MIDWTKPLEHVDGTPLVLDARFQQPDPDYYLRREDGLDFGESQRSGGEEYILVARPDGTQWNREGGILVRNRTSSSRPSDELVERMSVFIERMASMRPGLIPWHNDSDYRVEAQEIMSELNPIDPVVKRAREICSEVNASTKWEGEYLSGEWDSDILMRVAVRALREGM